jgi:hypothetical protein
VSFDLLPVKSRFIVSFLLFGLLTTASSRADLAVPPQVLDPKTPAEAWNVIRLATANVVRLIKEKRLGEVAPQVSLCSPALRTLARSHIAPEHEQRINDNTALAFRIVNDIARASMADQQQEAEVQAARLQATLDQLKPAFDPVVVGAEIYFCPQHLEVIATQPDQLCPQCNGQLRIRRIPYSDVYVKPGAPSVVLTVEAKGNVVAGTPLEAIARLATTDGQHVQAANLITTHSAKVCMLMVDRHLDDFHVIVPTETEKPGGWAFRFTPSTTGPYRIWADITPAITALPEYPHADLGGDFGRINRTPDALADNLTATVDGMRFQLTFGGAAGDAPRAQQTRILRIQVTDGSGQPVTKLQPLMNAFAHLTGIYEDGQTLIRLHPAGGEVLIDTARGGPWLAFKTYLPKPGYIRFFCQVRVDDRVVTAPFGVNIAP